MESLKRYGEEAYASAAELIEKAGAKAGQLFLVDCSTSEVLGHNPGTNSAPEMGKAVMEGVLRACRERSLFLCAQCCEHLNRAVVLEAAAAERYGYEEVNVIPQPKAGGSFATALWQAMEAPCAVEHVKAHMGLDIGCVMIGMNMREVAVPVRLAANHIGQALVIAARTRPRFIGGDRAVYDSGKK
jgi:uncharacterized protein (TIGR01440 family)